METITYKNNEIEAEQIGNLSDYTTDEHGNRRSLDEQLWRDLSGRYYVARIRFDMGTGINRFESVHRLSLHGAIQWAINLTGCDGLALRQDANAFLRRCKSPHAASEADGGEIMRGLAETDDLRRDVVHGTRRFSDGSMTLTMHLKPAVASLVRAVSEMDDDTPLCVAYTGLSKYLSAALNQDGGGQERERELDEIFSANAPQEHRPEQRATLRLLMPGGAILAETELSRTLFDGLQDRATNCDGALSYVLTDLLGRGLRVVNEPGRIIELDNRAQALVEKYAAENRDEHTADRIEVPDIVNGVLVNWLEAMLRIREGRTDGEAVEEARSRRVIGITDDDKEVAGQEASCGSVSAVRLLDTDGSVFAEVNFEPDLAAAIRGIADAQGLSFGEALLSLLRSGVKQPMGNREVTHGTRLDPEASALVDRFLKNSTHDALTADDVVNGCVVTLLEMACRAFDDTKGHRLAQRERVFADDECGHTERAAFNAFCRRNGQPEFDESEDDAEREVYDEQAARRLGFTAPDATARHDEQPSSRSPIRARTREAAFSLNASKPEPASAEEITAAHSTCEEQPTAIRDGLLHLAADWRNEGARTGGRIASVLARCADALEAALEGKEGR